jgi:hypothetical protein
MALPADLGHSTNFLQSLDIACICPDNRIVPARRRDPSAAISEIAKGMSDLRDALKAMTELAAGDSPVSALAPYLRQAWPGAAAVSMVCAWWARWTGPAGGPQPWSGWPARCSGSSRPPGRGIAMASRSTRGGRLDAAA